MMMKSVVSLWTSVLLIVMALNMAASKTTVHIPPESHFNIEIFTEAEKDAKVAELRESVSSSGESIAFAYVLDTDDSKVRFSYLSAHPGSDVLYSEVIDKRGIPTNASMDEIMIHLDSSSCISVEIGSNGGNFGLHDGTSLYSYGTSKIYVGVCEDALPTWDGPTKTFSRALSREVAREVSRENQAQLQTSERFIIGRQGCCLTNYHEVWLMKGLSNACCINFCLTARRAHVYRNCCFFSYLTLMPCP
ncbi:hypothetical protein NDN08_007928 [Rhodosorus marinus]|uniref:Uncharacterized protein n=1 Tax=Rhodosorus marinus TaxID=101924 RepID=A0AAV8V0J3_9RHOD|nr:hypothetical protein NDN08_007928 [Rhodosorus marinus]